MFFVLDFLSKVSRARPCVNEVSLSCGIGFNPLKAILSIKMSELCYTVSFGNADRINPSCNHPPFSEEDSDIDGEDFSE